MLESLGPVISLFKLLLEGLSKASKSIKTNRKRNIRRKIIEIQLSLEDIIDNAQEIFSFVELCSHKTRVNKSIVRDLESLLYRQHHRIDILLIQISDPNSDELMKLFAPDIRRNIIDLIHMKRGFIQEVLRTVSYLRNIEISKNQLIVNIQSELLNWNHEKFISEGHSYLRSLYNNREKRNIVISERLSEQKEIVDDLVQCSKGLSRFIKKHIGIEEFFGLTKRKSN